MTSACTQQIRKFLSDRIVLGTAQIGMNYGIANQSGKPDFQEVLAIVRTATEAGIDTFDTATAYGDSEQSLGRAFAQLKIANNVNVMSKLGKQDFESPESCVAAVQQCVERLRVKQLSLIFAHAAESLQNAVTANCFAALKDAGLVGAGGVSVYNAKEALDALAMPEIDVVQMPLNVFDMQAITDGVIDAARESGKKLIFRSVFLQGLLLMPIEKVPQKMSFALEFLKPWHQLCARLEVPPRVMALQCALSMAGSMPLLIGCESATQLRQNIDALDYRASHVDEALAETSKLAAGIPEKLRNPSLWPTH